MTRLNGALPKGDRNGVEQLAPDLVADPHRVHVVLALLDCKKITTDADTGDVEATARIRRIEAIPAADRDLAGELLRKAFQARTGAEELPFDLEQDVMAAFDDHQGEPDERGDA